MRSVDTLRDGFTNTLEVKSYRSFYPLAASVNVSKGPRFESHLQRACLRSRGGLHLLLGKSDGADHHAAPRPSDERFRGSSSSRRGASRVGQHQRRARLWAALTSASPATSSTDATSHRRLGLARSVAFMRAYQLGSCRNDHTRTWPAGPSAEAMASPSATMPSADRVLLASEVLMATGGAMCAPACRARPRVRLAPASSANRRALLGTVCTELI